MSYIKTKDGSYTYISPIYGEAFHSRHGAIQESQHVFIEQGFNYSLQKDVDSLRIFEMGFGSGLNALLTILAHQDHPSSTEIIYDSIEKHPLPWSEAKGMEFCQNLRRESKCESIFQFIHQSGWNERHDVIVGFSLQKIKGDLLEYDLQADTYDLIYYDAFAPSAQAELWSKECCQLLYGALKEKGILTTYCAQGQFKRNLKSVGFKVESPPGPPGKREMTRAIKM